MSEDRDDEGIERAERLIPELSARLRRHGLGEIEVRDGDLRLRVTAGRALPSAEAPAPVADEREAPAEPASTPGTAPVASPGVGYFLYADGLGPGLEVTAGDVIGHVEVLGVRHDVRVPADGTIRNLVAETGEAVEYGQTLVELEPAR
jgi:acetyl-CoA carboxylase biotin carboxyl carrier protein